jgi:hypothetical protein
MSTHSDNETQSGARLYKHTAEERAAMTKAKALQQAEGQVMKYLHKLVKALHQMKTPVETFLIAYQLEGRPVRSISLSNLSLFVQLSNGFKQVFDDACCGADRPCAPKFQDISDAFSLLDKEELCELARHVGHNQRLKHYREKFSALDESEELSNDDNGNHMRANCSSESTEATREFQQPDVPVSRGIPLTQKESSDASSSKQGPKSHEVYSKQFEVLSKEQKQAILITLTSRLNCFQLQVGIMMGLEILDPGIKHF